MDKHVLPKIGGIPVDQTGKAHRVPLSRQALDLVREVRNGTRGHHEAVLSYT